MIPAEELAAIGSVKDAPTVLGQTLDSDAEVMAHAAATPFADKAKEHVLKIEKLARAISTIDGVPFSVTEEEKSQNLTELGKARKLIYKWHPPVINRVYEELVKLEAKRDQAVAALEKNAPTPTTSTGAGK